MILDPCSLKPFFEPGEGKFSYHSLQVESVEEVVPFEHFAFPTHHVPAKCVGLVQGVKVVPALGPALALGPELHVDTVGHCRVDPSETQRIFPSVTEGKEVALCFFCAWLRLHSHVQFSELSVLATCLVECCVVLR